jgi:endonuclease YncB( thermonuclease family)
MKLIIYFIVLVLIAVNIAVADDFLELREYRNRLCYDGDTCYVAAKTLPKSLRNMSIRILGIDTPEIRANCPEEKSLALQGRAFANDMFKNADNIEFRNLKWDKYGGRILADVYIDGISYKNKIIEAGLAREYYGDKKIGWCN